MACTQKTLHFYNVQDILSGTTKGLMCHLVFWYFTILYDEAVPTFQYSCTFQSLAAG